MRAETGVSFKPKNTKNYHQELGDSLGAGSLSQPSGGNNSANAFLASKNVTQQIFYLKLPSMWNSLCGIQLSQQNTQVFCFFHEILESINQVLQSGVLIWVIFNLGRRNILTILSLL
jgi:hypothetical protein